MPRTNIWTLTSFKPEDNPHGLVEESQFSVAFPKFREAYIKSILPALVAKLEEFKLKIDVDYLQGSFVIKTTRKTFDPFIIIKGRDMLKLIGRGADLELASKILLDDYWCDIIKIGNMVVDRKRLVKRRQRLVGPNGATQKAIEILTECQFIVQGKTVAVIGKPEGLKLVRKIVEDCMNNIHPVYNIKSLMIRKELAKNDKMKSESWDRYIPKYVKKYRPEKTEEEKLRIKKKKEIKRKIIERKKNYTPFPPERDD
ncbi:hypothetical protein EIN_485560 [Entamoeba invadens IP1]|uniref:KRR-R motif-containing protein 1 n=1 Tax=Entamoeba invadens IP1 TaxID=370355 RepID=A0A0A1U4N8_ENTIV|nr:hypothetical protein EIN_485560 [Entamoeba invadens IP1]ELP89164.1 hypothetical protein EIN_485560 [Entamoeba invadens IP1]|eukprot:XP_004255935.1 hypothetical protein EIN_485560 [Entamoeba invadens IP1]